MQARGEGITQDMNTRKQGSGVATLEAACFSLFILNITSKNRNYVLIVKNFKPENVQIDSEQGQTG